MGRDKREYMRAWRARRAEHIKEYAARYWREVQKPRSAEYYADNRERMKATKYAWEAANPEAAEASRQRFLESHRDYLRRYEQERYKANREAMLARNRAWRFANPERRAEAEARRRAAKKRNSTGRVDYVAIIERDRGLCHICGKAVGAEQRSFDHLIPLSRGGPHTASNIRLAHRSCNSSRGAGRIPTQLLLPEWV